MDPNYFANKLASLQSGTKKQSEVLTAFQEKIGALGSYAESLRQAQEQNKDSWVSQLGLEENGNAATAVNLGASLVSGASRVAGQVTALPAYAGAYIDTLQVSDQDFEAYSRIAQGKASPEDLAAMNRKTTINGRPEGPTVMEAIEQANNKRELGRDISNRFDIGKIVNQTNRNELTIDLKDGFAKPWEQVKEGWDGLKVGRDGEGWSNVASGLGQLIFNAGSAAVNNPKGALEYVVENVPQLALGMAGKAGTALLTTSNAGYAVDEYQKGIEKFQKENNGALPSTEQRKEMAMYAASLALAEQVGDVSVLKGIGKIAGTTDDAVATGFKAALKSATGAVAKATGTEAATEGYQTFAEGKANLKEATAEDIYVGAAIGGMAGGGMTASAIPVGAVKAAADANKEARAQAQVKMEELAAKAAEVQKVVDSGDVTSLLDKASPAYNPEKALSALQSMSLKEGVTPEQRTQYATQAKDAITKLDAELAVLKTGLDGDAQTKADLAQAQAKLNSLAPNDPARADTQMLVDLLNEELAAGELPAEQKATRQEQIKKLEPQLERARTLYEAIARDNVAELAKNTDVDAAVAEASPESVQKLRVLSMASPESVSIKQAQALASSNAPGVSQADKAFFQAHAEAQAAIETLKSMGKVSDEILNGDPKLNQKGLVQYRQRFGMFMSQGATRLADKEMAGLANFIENQTNKIAAFEEGVARFNASGDEQFVTRNKDGEWTVTPLTEAQKNSKRKKGEISIGPYSANLIQTAKTELDAMNKTMAFMQTYGQAAQTSQQPATTGTVANASPSPVPAQAPATAIAPANPAATAATPEAAPQQPAVPQAAEQAGADTAAATEPAQEQANVSQETQDQAVEAVAADEAPAESQAEAETAVESAGLSVYQNTSEDFALVRDTVAQKAGRDSGTKRPLVTINNFLDVLASTPAIAQDFLKKTLIAEQKQTLKFFTDKAASWSESLQQILPTQLRSAYNWENPAQYLMVEVDGKVDFDQNTKTAMVAAAMAWMGDANGQGLMNKPESINSILGRDENETVTAAEWKALAYTGVRRAVAANAIGRRIVQSLGLTATAKTPQNLIPKLEATLGAYALVMLGKEGMVDLVSISARDWSNLTGTETEVAQEFVRLARLPNNPKQLSPKANSVIEALKGSSNVIENVFNVEDGAKLPSFEPVEYNQARVQKGKTRVPKKLTEVLKKKNAEGNFLKMEMFDLVSALSPEMFLKIAGVQETDGVHINRRLSLEAKNEGIERDYNAIMEFVSGAWSEQGYDKPIYLQHVAWKNQRVGIENTVLNPQTSKIARHLLARESWKTQIDPKNAQQMENFKLRVLESFGVKTDKQSNVKSLAEWQAKIENPVVQAGVQALVYLRQNRGAELSQAQQQAVVDAVAAGGENMKTLDGLKALADLQVAQGQPFESDLVGEVDGVTNGPMLTNLLMGASEVASGLFNLINKGGFFQAGSQTNYNVFRGMNGVMDLYESTTSKVMASMRHRFNDPGFQSVLAFTGALEEDGKVVKAGRNIIKRPITALHFGSALGKAVEGMSEDFVELVFKRLEKAAEKGEDVSGLIGHLNNMLGGKAIDPKMDASALLERRFSDKEVKALKEHFSDTFGEATEKALETSFAKVLERKTTVNAAANLAFGLYNSLYQAARLDVIKGLGLDEKWDLTPEQEAMVIKKVGKVRPILATAMSAASNELVSGLSVSKTEQRLSGAKQHNSVAKFNKAVTGQASMSVNAQVMLETGPGVAPFSVSVHSFDSAVSHTAAILSEALNIHDAHVTGLGNYTEVARNLNQSLWQLALEYSPAQAMYESLERTVNGLVAVLSDPQTTPEMRGEVKKFLKKAMIKSKFKGNISEYLTKALQFTKQTAVEADQIRLGALAQMAHIDQYALEGGQYDVTDADRAEAQKRLDAVNAAGVVIPLALQEKLAQLDPLFDAAPVDFSTGFVDGSMDTEAETDEQFEEEQKTVAESLDTSKAELAQLTQSVSESQTVPQEVKSVVESVKAGMEEGLAPTEVATAVQYLGSVKQAAQSTAFGALGTPVIAPESDVVAMLEAKPVMSGKEAVKALRDILAKRGDFPGKDFYNMLLGMTFKVLPDNVQVKYVTPSTLPADVLASPAVASRGWYVPATDRTAPTLYLLSPDFVTSGLTAETMLHELVHAAIEHLIENPQTAEQKQAVEELKDLLDKSQQYVQANGLSQYAAAVADVQELVAWGMTNVDFQKDVLRKVKVTSKTKLQNIKDGLQAFVDSLVKLMFPKSKETEANRINGFASLVGNVALLYKGAAQGQKAKMNKGVESVNRVLSMATVPSQNPAEYTTNQVFAALSAAGNTVGFTQKLQSLLDDVVERLHGPGGAIKSFVQQAVGSTELDAWAEALVRGDRPFHGKVLAANVKFTEQEAFVAEQVEAVMGEVLGDKAAANSPIYRELEKVFAQAKEALKGKIDPDLYRFVFMPQGQNTGMGGKSDYMQRFVALALTHEGFNQSLQFETRKAELVFKGKTLIQRIEMLWRAALDWLGAKVAGTYLGQRADLRMDVLVRKLVQVEARNKDKLNGQRSMLEFLQPVEEKVQDVIKSAKGKVAQASNSNFVRQNRFVIVQAAGAVVNIVATDRTKQVLDALTAFSNKVKAGRPNEAMELVNYIKGPGQWLNNVIRMAKHVEGERKHIIHDVAKAVLSGFKDNGDYLKPAHKKAISAVLLRTGAHLLLDKFKVSGIQAMLEDKKLLQGAIDTEIAALGNDPNVHYWVAQAKGLGFKQATGWAGVARQNLNAHNIAHLYNSGRPSPANAKAVIPNIERLVALYGLKYSSESNVNFVLEVMKTEGAKGADNGVVHTLSLHAAFEKDSKEKLFKDSEALHMHGYLPEIHNPRVVLGIARSEAEAKELKDLGYEFKAQVPVDKNDPDQRPVFMYALKGAGLTRWQSGAFSTTGTNARGTQKHGQYFNPFDALGVANMQSMNNIYNGEQVEVDSQFAANPGFEPGYKNRLVPIVNAHGQTTDYRYMMKEEFRDVILERDNNFEHLLGVMAGTTYDKVESREQNKSLATALHQLYKTGFSVAPENFIMVGSQSQDPELREIWDLMPSNTKRDIQKIWGLNGMMVPKEMLLPLFGYRKATLSSLFDKDNRNVAEQAFVDFTTYMVKMTGILRGMDSAEASDYAKRTYLTVRKTEDMWGESVKVLKDTIVVKTGIVMLGNMTSNFSILAANGVRPDKIFTLQYEGLQAVMDYQRDRDALAQVKLKQASALGLVNPDELSAEQVRLEDRIARNPAKELIDAGLLPSIVEDVNMEDDPYSYRSALGEWAERKTQKLNRHVVNVAKQIGMTHDTTLYKVLNSSTQYSDFVARYALYKHETTKKNPLTKEQALFNASEAFVNYDLPLPRTLQYLDDHGFMNFIKYFFSIQRVIAKLVRDKPLQVINTVALNNMLGDFPIFLDSSALLRIGNNPFGPGALGLPFAVDDLLTVQMGSGMFK